MSKPPATLPNLGVLRAFVAAEARRQIGGNPDRLFDAEILHDLRLVADPRSPLTVDTVLDDDRHGRRYTVADLFVPATWGFRDDEPDHRQPDEMIGELEQAHFGPGWTFCLSPIFAPQASILEATVELAPDGRPIRVEFELD